MNYDRDSMLKGIRDTSWREMQAFAERVGRIGEGLGVYTGDASEMATCIVQAAVEELELDAEKERVKAAKQGKPNG